MGVFSIGHGIPNKVFEKELQYTARLLVDICMNTLATTSACEAADGRLGEALDVVSEDKAVALVTSLAKPFASLAMNRHV